MKKFTLILVCNILLLQGCTTSGGDKSASTSEQVKPQPLGENQAQPANNQAQEKKPEESDILASSQSVPQLLPSTNPQKRERETAKGRKDPFGLIAPSSQITYPEAIEAVNREFDPDTDKLRNSKCIGKSEPKSGPQKSVPQVNEARGVLVSGIINLEGENVAIIKTEDIPYQYQVAEGAYISGGEVLVKTISLPTSTNSVPYLILEQSGVEVVRKVGQEKEPPELPGPSIAELPLGSDSFGYIKGLALLEVNPKDIDSSKPIVEGVLCNDTDGIIRVSEVDLQVQEKDTNVVINSLTVELGTSYVLEPGQKAKFDGEIGAEGVEDQSLGLRGKNKEELNFIMTDWR